MKQLKLTASLVGAGILLFPISVAAETRTKTLPEFGGWQWLWSLVALILVAILAYFTTRFLAGKYGITTARHLKISESLTLGPNRQLHLVLVNGQVLLLGNSEHGLALIKEFTDPVFYQELSQVNTNLTGNHNSFDALLNKFMHPESIPAPAGRVVTLREGFEKIKSWRRTRD